MGRLTRYLLRNFAAGFAVCLVAGLGLYIVMDLSANLARFLKPGRADVGAFIANYYLFRLPFLFTKLCPIFGLLAAAFTLTYLEKRNELTPIKASGISMVRFTRPLLVVGVLLAGVSLALEQWVVPVAARQIYARNLERSDEHLWYQLVHDAKHSQYLFYTAYFPVDTKLEGVYLSRLDENMREREFLFAEEGRFDPDGSGTWVVRRGYRIRYDERGIRLGDPDRFDRAVLETSLLPSDMENRALVDELPLSQAVRVWKRSPSTPALGVRLHFRAAYPAANVLLLLLGLPVILAGARGRYFLGALATALVGGAYLGVVFLALKLGMSGVLPPFLAGWGPVILFGALAAALHDLIPS